MLLSAVSLLLRWDFLCIIRTIARCRLRAQKGSLYDYACVQSEYTNGHQTVIDEWLFSEAGCIWCLVVLTCCAGLSDRVFRCSGVPEVTIFPGECPEVVPADVAKVVDADATSLADAGILFPADSVGTLSPTDQDGTLSPTDLAGILFPADPAGVVGVGVAALTVADSAFMAVAGLADAGILFPADPVGTQSPTDQDGTLSPTDLAGMLFPADPAGILFPADPVGTLSSSDNAGILFAAVHAGTLVPVVPAGIPIPADPAGILFPADLAEPVTVGLADVAVAGVAPLAVPHVFTEPDLVTMIVADEVETVDGIPVYYGCDYDDSDYEDPGYFYEEWVDWCDFNAADGYYGFFPDDGEAQSPASSCGVRLVARALPGLCRPHHAMTVCYARTASRT